MWNQQHQMTNYKRNNLNILYTDVYQSKLYRNMPAVNIYNIYTVEEINIWSTAELVILFTYKEIVIFMVVQF